MKITKVTPLLVDRFCLVRIETDAGITGIGESGAWGQLEASAAAITKYAEYLVGKDPRPIEHHWNVMLRANHFTGGAISGAVSAIARPWVPGRSAWSHLSSASRRRQRTS